MSKRASRVTTRQSSAMSTAKSRVSDAEDSGSERAVETPTVRKTKQRVQLCSSCRQPLSQSSRKVSKTRGRASSVKNRRSRSRSRSRSSSSTRSRKSPARRGRGRPKATAVPAPKAAKSKVAVNASEPKKSVRGVRAKAKK